LTRSPLKKLQLLAVAGLPLVAPGDDLAALICAAIAGQGDELQAGDIVVVAQKIVSKSEGRYLTLASLPASPQACELAARTGKRPEYVEAILSESEEIVRCRGELIIAAHRLGYVMANAGIDESNINQAEGARVLLLPENPDGSAAALRRELSARSGVDVGVIVNDSFGRPFRNGVVSVALGADGVPSLSSQVTKPDLFGRPLRVTEVAIADQIASAASLLMGEADEGQPVIVVRGFASDAPRCPAATLVRPKSRDMFR
jgi:coenzyme F420-0:L-glutamate ligase / coenzyme F420-1:gamma-L-glutamate ligase